MDCAQARISLGVYVLGALEPAERAAVDAHLATCEGCRVELAEIADLPALLASLSEEAVAALANGWPQEWATPTESTDTPAAPGTAGRPGDLSAMRKRLKPFHTRLLEVAAVAAIALGTIGVALYAGQPDAGPYAGPALGPWQSTQGSNAADMRAIVPYRPMGWGTQVAVQVSGIPLNTPCAIESYERNGTTTVGGSWVTDSGEGKVWYTASTAVSRDSVTKFVITVAGHPATVITLPI
jgi:hypothetical protein